MPPLRSRREQWLLALLILRHDRDTSRDWLATTLWPDNDEQQALFYLRKALSNLRKALGPAAVRLTSPTTRTIRLELDGASADVVAFDKAIKLARSDSELSTQYSELHTAVALYKGPLLPACLEEWAVVERNQREQTYQAALESLAAISHNQGDPASAVHWLRLLITSDPYRESAYCALMRALADCGDKAALKQAYGDLRTLLRQELNVVPAPETELLYDQLMGLERPMAVPPAPSIDPSATRRHLPVPLSDLIGREDEITEILEWMSSRRLISLVGAGGIGKTRLAIAVAERALPRFEHGVWFVDLAPISEPDLVIPVTARVLGIPEDQRRPLTETLPEALKSHSLLLVLDNCEHLKDSPASVANLLLSACPSLAIIATSRQALEVTGEQIFRVPSLPVPPVETVEQEIDPNSLIEFEAVRLFVDRAVRVDKSFRLNRQNSPAVIEICRSLDGIPLAIEMAAARIKSLSVGEIQAKLADRFRLLTTGNRVALPRQHTLRAAIDWSYELLNEQEKALLCRLSVFAGGCTLVSAEEVCMGDPLEEEDILDLLASLADKSLAIKEEHNGVTRYRLLETVRQYAADRLQENGQLAAWRDRHLEYFLALAEEAEPHLLGKDVQTWQGRLEIEHDNFRSALAWATGECTGPESGMRICGALHYFWLGSGYFGEGRNWCQTALARANQNERSAARAETLLCAAGMAYAQGDFHTMIQFDEESLSIWRELENPMGIARALNGLGITACDQGDYDAARSFHEQSLEIRRKLGDPWTISQSLCNLGVVEAAKGDYTAARPLLEESLSIRRRELGIHRGTAIVLHNLGKLTYLDGDYVAARAVLEESLSIRREVADRSRTAESLLDLGNVAFEMGDLAGARSRYEESLSIWADLHVQEGLARLLDSFAELAAEEKEIVRGARLWGAAESVRKKFGGRLWRGEQRRRDTRVAAARAALGDDAAFDTALADGRALSMDDAIAIAREST